MEKWLILLLDGAADDPIDALDGKTPLESASLPTLDLIAMRSTVGVTPTIPDGAPVQPESALLCIIGYEPFVAYTRRGAWLASALDVHLDVSNVAMCATLMSTDGENVFKLSNEDVEDEEVEEVVSEISFRLSPRRFELMRATKLQHLLIWHDGSSSLYCPSPEDIHSKKLVEALPVGEKDWQLHSLIYDVVELLDSLELNKRRRDEGKLPINFLLPHDPAHMLSLPSAQVAFGMLFVDAVTTHIPVIGACRAAGVFVHHPSWYSVRNWSEGVGERFEKLLSYVLELLSQTDVLIVHIREADLAGHAMDHELKAYVLQEFDERFIRPLWYEWDKLGEISLLVVCTHKTLCQTGKHESGLMPFLIYPPIGRPNAADAFYELCALEDGLRLDEPTELTKLSLPLREPIKISKR